MLEEAHPFGPDGLLRPGIPKSPPPNCLGRKSRDKPVPCGYSSICKRYCPINKRWSHTLPSAMSHALNKQTPLFSIRPQEHNGHHWTRLARPLPKDRKEKGLAHGRMTCLHGGCSRMIPTRMFCFLGVVRLDKDFEASSWMLPFLKYPKFLFFTTSKR